MLSIFNFIRLWAWKRWLWTIQSYKTIRQDIWKSCFANFHNCLPGLWVIHEFYFAINAFEVQNLPTKSKGKVFSDHFLGTVVWNVTKAPSVQATNYRIFWKICFRSSVPYFIYAATKVTKTISVEIEINIG